MEEDAEKNAYKVVYCSTENDPKKGRELIRMLSQRQVDGYLITPAKGMEKDIQELADHKKPLVLMDSYFPSVKVPYVLVDNASGVTQAVEHLIKKGYRKIGFVNADLELIQMKERESAYIKALKANKIPVSKKLMLKVPYRADKDQIIKSVVSFIKASPSMDAIFFATNYLGIAGLESIRQLNLKIPSDIAMVCFDDHDIFRLYPPGISSVQQPVEAIAKTAIQLLMQQLGKDKTN